MDKLKIGWGKREISMEGPVSMPGQMYTRLSQGVHDPVCVTALCLDGGAGQDAVIFCSCDIVNVREAGFKATIEALKKKDPSFPTDWVIMNATHTHASIDTSDISDTAPDGAYRVPGEKSRAFFAEQASEAILEAWNTRKEGKMSFGYGYAVVGHSRRSIYFDDTSKRVPNPVSPNGHGVMYGKTNDEMFSHYEAGAEHMLNAMYTFDANDKLTGMIANVPCPSQLSEHFKKLSADFWNEVREGVKAEFGEGVYVLPQCAAAGDLSPRTLHYLDAQARRMQLKFDIKYSVDHRSGPGASMDEAGNITEDHYWKVISERKDIAERIVNSLKEVYSWASKEKYDCIPVKHVHKILELSRRMITEEEMEWCKENLEYMTKDPVDKNVDPEVYRRTKSTRDAIYARNEGAVKRFEDQKEKKTLPFATHAVQVGEIAFTSNPVELYMDYMHRIQARSPFIQTFVVQLSSEKGSGYLATERGVANKGYSATIFDNMFSVEGGQEYVEETLKILNQFKAEE